MSEPLEWPRRQPGALESDFQSLGAVLKGKGETMLYSNYEPGKAGPQIMIGNFSDLAAANYVLFSLERDMLPTESVCLEPNRHRPTTMNLIVTWSFCPPERERVIQWQAFARGVRHGWRGAKQACEDAAVLKGGSA